MWCLTAAVLRSTRFLSNRNRLKNYNLDLKQVFDAIGANNTNTGGGYIEYGDEALVVRGIGLLKSAEEIGEIVVDTNDGVPVRIRGCRRDQRRPATAYRHRRYEPA